VALVQVLLPAYNAEKYLSVCLDSLLISQTFNDFEVLALNDGSTDKTASILKSYADRFGNLRIYENSTNLGIIESRNKLFRLATSEYLALADADDIYKADRIEKQYRFLTLNPSVSAVSGGYIALKSQGDFVEYYPPTKYHLIRDYLTLVNVFPNPAAMIKKSIIDTRQLRFNSAYKGAADFLFWQELSNYTEIFNLPNVLFSYRRHDSQESTANSERQVRNHIKVVNRYLASMELSLSAGAIACLVWPNSHSQNISNSDLSDIVGQIACVIERLKAADKKSKRDVSFVWDVRLKSFCKNYGIEGFKAYVKARGFISVIRGRRLGTSFFISCIRGGVK
jgi:glycosyltransferase involved in cell wall biosynthesis